MSTMFAETMVPVDSIMISSDTDVDNQFIDSIYSEYESNKSWALENYKIKMLKIIDFCDEIFYN